MRASAALLVLAATLLSGCIARWSRHDLADGAGHTGSDALAQYASTVCKARRALDDQPQFPFTSDGCSSFPDDGWVACCVDHDIDYWCGGTAADRVRSDARLNACVAKAENRHLGDLMYWGVRAGGVPWHPFPFRWAYGFTGIRGYDR